MASTFDVVPAELSAGAGDLADDATALSGGCTTATSEVGVAAGGVNGGELAAALAGFAAELADRGTTMVDAVDGAGQTLSANARRYVSDDEDAHASLTGTVPE